MTVIADIVRDVAELPDRTSPEGQPDMMLVTAEELASILARHRVVAELPFEVRYQKEQDENNRLLASWRGRRLLICRATDKLMDICKHLGEHGSPGDGLPTYLVEFGPELTPGFPVMREGLPHVTGPQREELQNMVALLLRMILLSNDGHVSHHRLQRF